MPRLVVMKDRAPLVLKKADISGDDLWVCRCGLSANWPLCDDSHHNTKGEQGGKLYEYGRKAKEDAPARAEVAARPTADPRPWDPGNRKLADALKDA
ncbi:MAG TPA: CDGSH iron-sulfur domain-containing protein [Candidatus Thermoplasmatota archaeon]